MSTYIYLDQNVLSYLRPRKLDEQSDQQLEKLYSALIDKGKGLNVVYSATHLDEIRQINIPKYIDEHIDLLCSLNALYIEPVTTQLNAKNPQIVWRDYLENEAKNRVNGHNEGGNILDLLSRKFAGLEVGQDFDDLHCMWVENINKAVAEIKQMLEEGSPEQLASHQGQQMKQMYEELKKQAEGLKTFSLCNIGNEQELGPRSVRSHDDVIELDLENREPHEVIPTIDELFSAQNGEFKWENYFDDTVHNQIARCYTLMNWVGYHADDFTKVKKRGDRFKASTNDLMHVRNSAGASFLVSNDDAFLKKARACYAHLNVSTSVLYVEEFVKTLNL